MSLAAKVGDFLDATFDHAPPRRIGVAVSGGGDSMALLHLVVQWARPRGVECHAVTVDHGLRPEAAAEAALVARACETLSASHEVLGWTWDGQGNLQDAARRARRGLIAQWARQHGIDDVCLGHTRDDQAETVVMRLARGSGVDGLAGMRGVTLSDGINWLRPLLDIMRADLRDWLTDGGHEWAEDPSNRDPRFDRVRARQAIAALELDPKRLARTARQMAAAEAVLHRAAIDLSRAAVTQDADDLILDRAALRRTLHDTRWRLVAAALRYVGGGDYRPRFDALEAFTEALLDGQGRTLAGVLSRPEGTTAMRLTPEHGKVAAVSRDHFPGRDNFHDWFASH